MAGQTRNPTLEEIRRSVQEKERELSELDLMLADYKAEHSRLIRELRTLQAQLRDADATASLIPERKP